MSSTTVARRENNHIARNIMPTTEDHTESGSLSAALMRRKMIISLANQENENRQRLLNLLQNQNQYQQHQQNYHHHPHSAHRFSSLSAIQPNTQARTGEPGAISTDDLLTSNNDIPLVSSSASLALRRVTGIGGQGGTSSSPSSPSSFRSTTAKRRKTNKRGMK